MTDDSPINYHFWPYSGKLTTISLPYTGKLTTMTDHRSVSFSMLQLTFALSFLELFLFHKEKEKTVVDIARKTTLFVS